MDSKSALFLSVCFVFSLTTAMPALAMTATQIGPYPNKIACDFYQTTAKKVTNCTPKKDAHSFCRVAMKSRLSRAIECNQNGRIVCTRPCSSVTKTKPLDHCAYDPERRSGYEITPYSFCASRPSP